MLQSVTYHSRADDKHNWLSTTLICLETLRLRHCRRILGAPLMVSEGKVFSSTVLSESDEDVTVDTQSMTCEQISEMSDVVNSLTVCSADRGSDNNIRV